MIRAPHGLYGVKYIDPVSLAPVLGDRRYDPETDIDLLRYERGPSIQNYLIWLCALCFVWGSIY